MPVIRHKQSRGGILIFIVSQKITVSTSTARSASTRAVEQR